MKFSIVTLSFNQCEFLQQAMDSVLDQDYPEIEYIVVDPGSKDGSRDLIGRYGSRIQHSILEPDRGAADGLNRGFANATGDIYGFLNADDVFLPGAFRRVAEFFAANPDCDLVMGDGFIVDGAGKTVRHVKAAPFTPTRYFYGGTIWLQQSTFFRHEIFSRVGGFNDQNTSSWDGELFLEMVWKGAKVGYLREDLALFRVHSASITGSGRLSKVYFEDETRLFRHMFGRDWGWSDDLKRIFYKSLRFLEDPVQLIDTLRLRLQLRAK